ncbi:hypothetical protein BDV95DRAFT_609648 [Massariosphaeria phaeospora]|uniref:Uncharacterized protein n=1 Tax=Massariosphaeria phaeospora TaxID=100035 RepID=A0A7C8M358_9PLEO|nr:hypothetical protein BDV95DRAFT_609648 [Massariosphaeria phaeospora]
MKKIAASKRKREEKRRRQDAERVKKPRVKSTKKFIRRVAQQGLATLTFRPWYKSIKDARRVFIGQLDSNEFPWANIGKQNALNQHKKKVGVVIAIIALEQNLYRIGHLGSATNNSSLAIASDASSIGDDSDSDRDGDDHEPLSTPTHTQDKRQDGNSMVADDVTREDQRPGDAPHTVNYIAPIELSHTDYTMITENSEQDNTVQMDAVATTPAEADDEALDLAPQNDTRSAIDQTQSSMDEASSIAEPQDEQRAQPITREPKSGRRGARGGKWVQLKEPSEPEGDEDSHSDPVQDRRYRHKKPSR